jgi:plasmid stability protein
LFDINAIIDYSRGMHASKHPAPASITIRNLDPALKERLRVRAAQHGQSMEAEARRILQTVLAPQDAPPARHLYDRVRARFAPLGGVELELPPREPLREPPRFD